MIKLIIACFAVIMFIIALVELFYAEDVHNAQITLLLGIFMMTLMGATK